MSIKEVRSQGVCQVRNFWGQRGGGSSTTDVLRTFWCKKLRIFWNLWCDRTDKEGLSQCEHFLDEEKG